MPQQPGMGQFGVRAEGAGFGCSAAWEPKGAAAAPLPGPDPAREVVLEAARGRRDQARAGGGEEGGGKGAERRGGGARSVCHSLSPSVYRGCAEWCA